MENKYHQLKVHGTRGNKMGRGGYFYVKRRTITKMVKTFEN